MNDLAVYVGLVWLGALWVSGFCAGRANAASIDRDRTKQMQIRSGVVERSPAENELGQEYGQWVFRSVVLGLVAAATIFISVAILR